MLEAELKNFIELIYGQKIINLSTNIMDQTPKINNIDNNQINNDLQTLWDDAMTHYEYLQNSKNNNDVIILKQFIDRLDLLNIDTNHIKIKLTEIDPSCVNIMSMICHAIVD